MVAWNRGVPAAAVDVSTGRVRCGFMTASAAASAPLSSGSAAGPTPPVKGDGAGHRPRTRGLLVAGVVVTACVAAGAAYRRFVRGVEAGDLDDGPLALGWGRGVTRPEHL